VGGGRGRTRTFIFIRSLFICFEFWILVLIQKLMYTAMWWILS